MKISYTWLNDRFFGGELPTPEKVASLLTMNSFEVESVDQVKIAGGASDTILDIKILPNRSHDCLSHKGIAREVATLLSRDLLYSPEKVAINSSSRVGSVSTADAISVSIEEGTLCNRATKRLVQGVKVGKSPEWLINYLQAVGQKPINNIVDAANFVMLETGQPVHTFDFDKIADVQFGKSGQNKAKKNIKIRNARASEEILCLDNKTYALDQNTIVISDDKQALDIAGIKGGHTSGIDENTKNVVLSACNFNSISIRKTSKRLGLRTDASVRFENGITPELVDEAMDLLSALIQKVAGGKIAGDIIDIYPKRKNKYVVGVSALEVNRLLGTKMSPRQISKTLERAKFEYKIVDPIKEVLSLAPTFIGVPYKLGSSISYDAPRSFDCSSFAGYIYAHTGVAIPRMSVDQYVFGAPIELKNIKPGDLLFFTAKNPTHFKTIEYMPGTAVPEGVDHVAIYMGKDSIIHATGREGVHKVIEESFEKSPIRNLFVGARRIITEKEKRFVVTVPNERLDIRIKEDLIEEIQRLSGYENIKTIKHKPLKKSPIIDKNLYYQNKVRNILLGLGFSEIYTYAFTNKGEVELQNPIASNKNFLRKNLADGMDESLTNNCQNLDLLGLDKIKTFEIGKVFDSRGEKFVLSIGIKGRSAGKNKSPQKDLEEVENKLKAELGASFETTKTSENTIEIDFSALIERLPTPAEYKTLEIEPVNDLYKRISAYPFIVRDIAVFVPVRVTSEKVLEKILMMAGPMVVKNKLFDVFTKKFPDGSEKTSYAFRLVFQSEERTLTDEEINKIMEGVIKTLGAEADWQVR